MWEHVWWEVVGTTPQKRCDDEQNDLVPLRWKFLGLLSEKRVDYPTWVFVTTSGLRKQSARGGEWRKGKTGHSRLKGAWM